MITQRTYKKVRDSMRPTIKKTKKGTIYMVNGVDKMIKKDLSVKYQGSSQADRFIKDRNPTFQYFIDVFALSFMLSVLLTIIMRVWK